MLRKIALLGALMISLTNFAFAGGAAAENYFDGVYGQVEVGFASQTNQIGYSYGGSATTNAYGNTAAAYAVTAGYSRQIADLEGIHDINLAANISYNFTNGNSGTDSNSTGYYYQLNTKNILALSVEPGYYLAEQAIAYLKFGYAQGQSNVLTNNPGGNVNFGTQSGPLFGFGFKHALDAFHSNMFWGLETYQINFRSKTVVDNYGEAYTSKPTVLFGKVHLGYIF